MEFKKHSFKLLWKTETVVLPKIAVEPKRTRKWRGNPDNIIALKSRKSEKNPKG